MEMGQNLFGTVQAWHMASTRQSIALFACKVCSSTSDNSSSADVEFGIVLRREDSMMVSANSSILVMGQRIIVEAIGVKEIK